MHTDKKKPTGSANYPAGHTDRRIVAPLTRRINVALLYVGALLAIVFGGLR